MASCANSNANNTAGQSNLPDISTSKFFDNYRLSRYNRLMDSIIGDIFRNYVAEKGWTVDDLQNPTNLRNIYRGVKQYLTNMLIDKYASDSTKWDRLSDDVAKDIDTIVENFDAFANEHIKYSDLFSTKDFNINDESTDEEDSAPEDGGTIEEGNDEEPEIEKGKEFDRPGNTESQVDLASNNIRTLFRLISRAFYNPSEGKTEIVYDKDGLPQPADYIKTWNLLADRLAGEKNYNNFINILTSERTKQVVPEVDQIISMLRVDKNDTQKSKSEVVQFTQFWQTFSKPRIPLQSAFFSNDYSFSLSDEILGNRQKIEIIFNNNFIENDIPEDYKGYVKRSQTGVYLLQKTDQNDNRYIPPIDLSYESQLKFLNFLGFQFSFLDLLSPDELQRFKEVVGNSAQRLYSSLKGRLEISSTQIREPIKELRKKFKRIPSESTSIKDLIEWESQYSQIAPTHSSRNAMGELQYLINQDSAVSIAAYHLNNSKTLDELMDSPPFRNVKYDPRFSTSLTINFLFDEKGNKRVGRTLDMILMSGFKKQEATGKVITQLERNLSEKNKIIQDYNNFLTSGRTDTLRTETSRSFFSIALMDKDIPYKYLNPQGFVSSFVKYRAFNNQILNYLNAEIARIKTYAKKKQENPSLTEKYKDFSIFSETSDLLKEKLKASDKLQIDSPLFIDFLNEYNNVLNNELSSLKSSINKNGIFQTELLSTQLKDAGVSIDALHRTFIAGTLLQNIEFSIFFSGDPLFMEDFHKRIKGLASTGNVAADIPLLSSFFSSDEEKTYNERYSLAEAMGAKRRDNTKDFRTQTLTEPISSKNGYTSPSFMDNLKKSMRIRDGKAISDEEIREIIKGADAIKVADGQGWINLDFHRELSFRFGFINPYIEDAYKYEGLIMRRDIMKQELSGEQEKEIMSLEKKIFSDPDKYAIPVLKMTYWGPIVNSTVDGKAYDKFSVAPILPSYARSKPLMEDTLRQMVQGDYGYVKYKSGTKAFATGVTASLHGAEPDLYATQLLKEQLKTSNEQGTDAALLTQELKLAFVNLFDNGKAKTEKVSQLYGKYVDALKGIQKEQRKRVMDDLGIQVDENGDIKSYDPIKLSPKLIREAKRQSLNSNVISALALNPNTSNFNGTLDASGFQKQVNDLVAGILDKTLRRFKFAGGDFVMISGVNQPKLSWYRFSEKSVESMEIRMTLTKEYSKLLNRLHPDGEKIGTIERLNRLIRSEEWSKENERALSVILARAPVEGAYSMGHGKVVEFLPPTMGNVVIMPDEVILQAGPDFDYDKQRIITPFLDDKGNYLTASPQERIEQIMEKIGELQDIYPELERLRSIEKGNVRAGEVIEENAADFINVMFSTSARQDMINADKEAKALIDEYFSLTNDTSALRNNRMPELFKDILSLPEMYSELVSPNSTYKMKQMALKNGENTKTNIDLPKLGRTLYYTENLKVFKIFFDAKNLLSAFAVDNPFQQLLSYQGININEHFNTSQFDSKLRMWTWKPNKITNLLLSLEEYDKISSNGRLLTSLRDDIDGYIKQHYTSQGMSVTVDAAKDPFVVLLKITLGNVGIVSVLKHMGIPFERIVDFVSNPSIQYYLKMRENGLNMNQAIDKLNKDRLFLRYETKNKEYIQEEQFNDYSLLPVELLFAKGLLQDNQTFKIWQEGKDFLVEKTTTIYLNGFRLRDLFKQIDNQEQIKMNGFNTDKDLINLNKYLDYKQMTPERLKFLANPDNDRLIVKNDPKRKDENISIFSDELRIISHFFTLDKISWAMGDMRRYFNFDKTKVSTLTDVNVKKKLREKIVAQDLFSASDVIKMEQDSILSAYINTDIIGAVYKKIFPLLGNTTVQATLSALYEEYETNFRIKNKRDMRNLPNTLNNDFISSVVFNYGEVGNQNIFDKAFPLLVRRGKETTMADKLAAFRKEPFYRELSRTYPIMDRFISNKQLVQDPRDPNGLTQPFVLESIQFIKNAQETLIEQEAVIEQLRDIYFNYRGEGQEKVKGFLDDLFSVGLVQSGFNKSFISYSEYLPYEFTLPIIQGAMKSLGKLNGEQLYDYMNIFHRQFRNNNPRYFPYISKGVLNNNKYWSKFKYYRNNRHGGTSSKSNVPSSSTPVSPITRHPLQDQLDIADKMTPIEQNFSDGSSGRKMQEQFKGKSTMQLIISGDRTRTTRSKTEINRMIKDYKLKGIQELIGKIIRMTDRKGNQVYTRITGVFDYTQEYQDATWQKEGWEKWVTDKIVGKYPYAIEFELVDTNQPQDSPIPDQNTVRDDQESGDQSSDTQIDVNGNPIDPKCS